VKDLEVESVAESDEGIRVGIVAYRNLQPPVTVLFEQKWGGEIKHIKDIYRLDGSSLNTPHASTGWRIYAKVLAEIVIKEREERRSKKLFQRTQPRLFD